MKRSYIREILDCINEDTISFAGGLPSSNNFPLKEIQEASKEVSKKRRSFTIYEFTRIISFKRTNSFMVYKRFGF